MHRPPAGYVMHLAPALARTATALAHGKPLPQDVVQEGLIVENLSPRRFATRVRPA